MPHAPKFTPHPKSAPGDFYVVKGECLACGVPQVVAPDLVGWTGEEIPHCFWKKQPETEAEFERAVGVLEAQELECHRYAGADPAILDRRLHSPWFHLQQFVLRICDEELSVHPKALRNRDDTEDGSFCFRFLGFQNLRCAHLCQLLDGTEIVVTQPIRDFWILRFGSS